MEYCLEFKKDLHTNAIAAAFQQILEKYHSIESPISKARIA